MKLEQIVAALVRIFVVYLLLVVVFQYGITLTTLIKQNQQIDPTVSRIFVATFFTLLLILGLLWRFALRVGRGIVPKDETTATTPVTMERLEVLGFSLVGLWAVVYTLPEFLQFGFYVLKLDAASSRTMIGLYGSLAQCLIGLGLMVGARPLARGLQKLRAGSDT